MAAEAAMRAGAGYVTVLAPAGLQAVLASKLLEVMTVALPEEDGAIAADAVAIAQERAERADAVVLGPGLGRTDAALHFARRAAQAIPLPLLLDADGLNAHAGALESLRDRTAPTVLTPHAGELGRLLERESSEIAAHRLESVRTAAQRAQAVVVLKGDDTLVAHPDGRVAVNRGGAPALATAGTGDVLSGVVGAYLAKGMDAFHAACAGVFVHAAAGRVAAREIGEEGVIASDVIATLPRALPPAAQR
jgi:NAD(P)H-hydrate epimerase